MRNKILYILALIAVVAFCGDYAFGTYNERNKVHIHMYSDESQFPTTADTQQEVTFNRVADEHGGWSVQTGQSNTTTTVPYAGTYSISICFQIEKQGGPVAVNLFEYALFRNNDEILGSGGQRTVRTNSEIGSTCRMSHLEMEAGDEITVKMSSDVTNVGITSTSTVFGATPTASLVIIQLDK